MMSGCGSDWQWGNDPPQIDEFSMNGTKIGADGKAITPAQVSFRQ
jgi:hypothetical protein